MTETQNGSTPDIPEAPSVSAELSSGLEGAVDLIDDRPELAIGGAFVGGLALALLLRRFVNR